MEIMRSATYSDTALSSIGVSKVHTLAFWGKDQSLGSVSRACLRWRRLISPLIEATTKPAVLSPSSFTFSSSSIKSRGTRDTICCDLLFLEPVAISDFPLYWWHSVYAKKKCNQYLKVACTLFYCKCMPPNEGEQKKQRPVVLATHTGRLTTMLLEITRWLIHSLPKHAPNISIVFWHFIERIALLHLAACLLKPIQSRKPVRSLSLTSSSLLLAACQLRRFSMFDNTPLELDEIIDQCRALAYTALNITDCEVREILLFVLQERIDHLYRTRQEEPEEAEVQHES
ncbi:hypothetical protein C5E00_22105 [Pectobacterium parmentieri]|uniref:Uncharacterized protein n=2 Tax=Pectobacterium parmentieri TaxID=1905730 RepID=A0A8B3F990_PECPM|nr:hypothetical protein C5E00_22105 [Pectobacterium parmentieri]